MGRHLRRQSYLAVISAAIFAIGLLMIFSTASGGALDLERAHLAHAAFIRQVIYAIVGTALGAAVYLMGYKTFLRLSPILFILFTIFLLLTLIPGIGKEVNGARRWIGISSFAFQPSEFVKIITPCFFLFQFRQMKGPIALAPFIKLALISAIPIFFILIEPNNGTAAVVALTLTALFFLLAIPAKYWLLPLLAVFIASAAFAVNLPYVRARLQVYFHPELDLKGRGHQPYQAKIAAGSGKLWGKGPGNSLQKFSYLPEAQNDYIAAIFAEEFGFFGIALLITLYVCFTYAGFLISMQSKDLDGYYLGAILTLLIPFQAFLNLGVVSGLLPSTGLNLPLFSQGGTSLIANCIAIALLLSVAKVPTSTLNYAKS